MTEGVSIAEDRETLESGGFRDLVLGQLEACFADF
jgi:hypothetical protein